MIDPDTSRVVRRAALLLVGLLAATAGMYATIVPVTSLLTPDELSNIAYGYSLVDGDLPTIYDDQQGGPYTYQSNRSIYTANHPPLFYTLEGPLVSGLNLVTEADSAIRLARWLSVGFAALTALATVGLISEFVPNRPQVWILGAFMVALVPELAYQTANLYNDSLALFLSTSALWAGARIHRRGLTARPMIYLAICATGAALTRASALPIALLAVGTALLGILHSTRGPERLRSSARLLLVTGLPMATIAGPFYLRNQRLYGDATASDALFEMLGRKAVPTDWLFQFDNWRLVLAATLTTIRGDSYMTSTSTQLARNAVIPLCIVVLCAAAYVLFRLFFARVARTERRRRVELALLAVACVLITIAGFGRHVLGGGLPHARYLFPTYWVIGLTVAIALRALGNRVTGAVCALLATASFLHLLIRLDRIVTRSWREETDVTVIDRWQTAYDHLGLGSLVIVLACGSAVVACSVLLLRDIVTLGRPTTESAAV
ncbi:hypothetical protein [Actinospongicola halichondriae]|uniref:hypothetical protein n=1 Tax=Actinospongicola halichondriae TaxID=3236844 RepID=UPI003D5AEE31